jgi:hypothetical protein
MSSPFEASPKDDCISGLPPVTACQETASGASHSCFRAGSGATTRSFRISHIDAGSKYISILTT